MVSAIAQPDLEAVAEELPHLPEVFGPITPGLMTRLRRVSSFSRERLRAHFAAVIVRLLQGDGREAAGGRTRSGLATAPLGPGTIFPRTITSDAGLLRAKCL